MNEFGQRYFGVYLGTVVDADDPDEMGRLRLETDQYEDSEDDPTWAAVVRPLAGDASTVFFSPKPGDQVVLSFLAGDVRQPIVMGYAHTTERKPTGVSPQKHTLNVSGLGSITFDEENSRHRDRPNGHPRSDAHPREREAHRASRGGRVRNSQLLRGRPGGRSQDVLG